MLYFHTVRGADAGAKINNPRGAVRTRQNIPKPHRVRAVRGAVDISNPNCFHHCSEMFNQFFSDINRIGLKIWKVLPV